MWKVIKIRPRFHWKSDKRAKVLWQNNEKPFLVITEEQEKTFKNWNKCYICRKITQRIILKW